MKRQWHSQLQASDFSRGRAPATSPSRGRDGAGDRSSERRRSRRRSTCRSTGAGVYVVEVQARDRLGRAQIVGRRPLRRRRGGRSPGRSPRHARLLGRDRQGRLRPRARPRRSSWRARSRRRRRWPSSSRRTGQPLRVGAGATAARAFPAADRAELRAAHPGAFRADARAPAGTSAPLPGSATTSASPRRWPRPPGSTVKPVKNMVNVALDSPGEGAARRRDRHRGAAHRPRRQAAGRRGDALAGRPGRAGARPGAARSIRCRLHHRPPSRLSAARHAQPDARRAAASRRSPGGDEGAASRAVAARPCHDPQALQAGAVLQPGDRGRRRRRRATSRSSSPTA